MDFRLHRYKMILDLLNGLFLFLQTIFEILFFNFGFWGEAEFQIHNFLIVIVFYETAEIWFVDTWNFVLKSLFLIDLKKRIQQFKIRSKAIFDDSQLFLDSFAQLLFYQLMCEIKVWRTNCYFSPHCPYF